MIAKLATVIFDQCSGLDQEEATTRDRLIVKGRFVGTHGTPTLHER